MVGRAEVRELTGVRSRAFVVVLIAACLSPITADEVQFSESELRRIERLSPLGAPPPDPTNRVADDPRAVRLGEKLFFDPRLSGGGTISCATCHDPARDFIDGLAVAKTISSARRNTPSLWNVAWGRSFFWDGRASTLWGQAIGPIENPVEMGGDRLVVLRRLAGDGALRAEFEALFGEWPDLARFPERAVTTRAGGNVGPTDEWRALPESERSAANALVAQLGKVLAAYQRTIRSGETPFDRFVLSLRSGTDDERYPAAARRGLKLFVGSAGCHLCHHGPTLSDQAFHATGVAPCSRSAAEPGPEDPGRYGAFPEVRNDPFRADGPWSDAPDGEAARRARGTQVRGGDFGAFRTPGLRNVARTPPYMHAGQFSTLEEVLCFYSSRTGEIPPDPSHPEPLNAPLYLTDGEVADLVAFLGTLSDEPVSPPAPR